VLATLAIAGWMFPTPSSVGTEGRADGPAVAARPSSIVTASSIIAEGPVLLHGPAGAITVADPGSHRAVYSVGDGLLSPRGDRVYTQKGTFVVIRDADSGERLARVPRPRDMELQVASTSGELMAFAPPLPDGATDWAPGGKSKTLVTVVPTDRGSDTRSFELDGNFVPEAFATNDKELYMIEFLPARSPWHFGLRRLNLASGKIREIAREKQGAPDQMNGTGKLAAFSPQGHELYTLYTQQGPNYTHVEPDAADDQGDVYAFVHLLNLNGGWTHCIDLPAPFGTGDATTHAMAVSPDGSSLYVADPSSGGLALIDPVASRVTRSVTTDLGALRNGAAAAVGADGTLYLAGRDEILAFDGTSLSLIRTLPLPHGRPGISVGPDGTELFIMRGHRMLILDATTGVINAEVQV
jgi:hypothetical protein